jgi:hypothetical protein
MIGRLAAAFLVAGAIAGLAAVGAAACGGDAFTMASGDGSAAAGPDGTTGDDGAGGGGGEAASDDGARDAIETDGGAEADESDAIALPDVLDEAPAHCAADEYQCIPAIPAGWQGPFEVYRGAAPPSDCSPNFFPSYRGNEGVDAGPAACGCACATASGVDCSPVVANFYVSTAGITGCTSLGKCTSVALPTGECIPNVNASSLCSSLLGSTLVTFGASSADGGSCAPVPSVTLPDAGWSITTQACVSMVALARADCPLGQQCAPKPASPFPDSSLCIAQVGNVPCPNSDYPNRSVSFGGLGDGRHCAACSCGPVTGSTCTGYVDVTPAATGTATPCSGNYTRYLLPQSCTGGIQQPGDLRATVTPQPGSCAPTTGTPAPLGTVTPSAPTTFCCQ